MAGNRYQTANQILNKLVEVGLDKVIDPWGSSDPNWQRAAALLQSSGELMLCKYAPERLTGTYTVNMVQGDDGTYDLPTDFERMIPQTGWNLATRLPVAGSLTPQQWNYLNGRGLAGSAMWVSFRQVEGVMQVFPPGSATQTLTFEYLRNTWVEDSSSSSDPKTLSPTIQQGADVILLPHVVIGRLLITRWKKAFGFESDAADAEFMAAWEGAGPGGDVVSQRIDLANGPGGSYNLGNQIPSAANG